MIPKKIHYCWLSGEPYPEDIKKYMASWKEHLPDYEFILWDSNRFDLKSSIWCKQAFEAKKYAFAADYIRLYAVYHEGGIYLDSDIEVLKSFNEALDTDIMMAYEQSHDCMIEAGCFGAVKHHPFIKACMNYYENREFIKPSGSYDMEILPLIMSEIIQKDFSFEDIVKLPPTVFTSKSSVTGLINYDESHYAIHHFTSHWSDKHLWLSRKIQWDMYRIFGDTKVAGYLSKSIFLYGATRRFYLRYKDQGTKQTYQHYKDLFTKLAKKRLGKSK